MDGVVVRRRLAVGGMAELFLADQTLPDGSTREIVVKRALPGTNAAYLTYLAREREVLGQLDSPAIVQLLGGEDDYLLLEYVEGPDLATLLDHLRKRGKTLSLGAAMAVITGLLQALSDLHTAGMGLVHRDVNPANILVRAADGAVKLTDLGVVHTDIGEKSTLGGLKGTLAYMAPEQLQGRPVDVRSDLYAAGLVAYETLTGAAARPAGMIGVSELLAARSTLPAPPSTLRPDLAPALDQAVLAALEPLPDARPADARTWLRSLLAAASIEPDSSALSEAAAGVTRGVASAVRTLRAMDTVTDAPPPRPAPDPAEIAEDTRTEAKWLGVLTVIMLAVAAPTLIDMLGPDESAAPPAPKAAAAPTKAAVKPAPIVAEAPRIAVVARPADLRERRRERSPATVAPIVVGKTPTTPKTPKTPKSPAEPATIRLQVRPAGAGAVHVTGAGASGLAPKTTRPLDEGSHVLRLVGGAKMLKATLRITRRGGRLSATIGAPAGRFYKVRCGGRERHTPVVGLRIESRLRCKLSDASGATMAFAVQVAAK